ncbi:hypothetical protein MVG78_15390 [Roseomonas gilardii subsp. gilardii]|uniref:hypothetical protein n=1 Tax=Roseomonas gilardii TaxID=257708 RepID=UPI001FF7A258|nr:hypothetical protein [Roseomonas gilardii]UPG71908.1 hypothetical protein MVG78_15390 [Roseomonas gilardii subsp. gilardii]
MHTLSKIGLAALMATTLMAAPMASHAAEGGGYSQYSIGSTPTDTSGAGSSATRGTPSFDMADSYATPGSVVRNSSNSGSSAVSGKPLGNMPASRFSFGSTPLDVSNNN